MRHKLATAIMISAAAHTAAIAAILFFQMRQPETAAGEREYIVSIDMISDSRPQMTGVESSKSADDRAQAAEHKPQSTSRRAQVTGEEDESTSGRRHEQTGTRATTGDGGTSTTLAEIKTRIEKSKRYPRLAKKMGLEGRPTVIFEINQDGSIKYVNITTSSGEKVIDDAAIETVMRSAPLPYYPGPIRLAIRYELN